DPVADASAPPASDDLDQAEINQPSDGGADRAGTDPALSADRLLGGERLPVVIGAVPERVVDGDLWRGEPERWHRLTAEPVVGLLPLTAHRSSSSMSWRSNSGGLSRRACSRSRAS